MSYFWETLHPLKCTWELVIVALHKTELELDQLKKIFKGWLTKKSTGESWKRKERKWKRPKSAHSSQIS